MLGRARRRWLDRARRFPACPARYRPLRDSGRAIANQDAKPGVRLALQILDSGRSTLTRTAPTTFLIRAANAAPSLRLSVKLAHRSAASAYAIASLKLCSRTAVCANPERAAASTARSPASCAIDKAD